MQTPLYWQKLTINHLAMIALEKYTSRPKMMPSMSTVCKYFSGTEMDFSCCLYVATCICT